MFRAAVTMTDLCRAGRAAPPSDRVSYLRDAYCRRSGGVAAVTSIGSSLCSRICIRSKELTCWNSTLLYPPSL